MSSNQSAGIVMPRLTPVVKILLVTNVALFVIYGMLFKLAPAAGLFVLDALALSVPGLMRLQIWTPVSYAFLHSLEQPFHLLFNMLMLFFFGPLLEQRWGQKRFILFFLLGATGGGVAFILVNLLVADPAPLIGASAAVLALVIAWGMIYSNQTVYFLVFPMRGKHLIYIIVAMEILFAVSQSPVSSAAHFGGMGTGALLISGYWRPARLGQLLRGLGLRRKPGPKFTLYVNPDDDDDRAPPGGWVQ